MKDRHDVEQGVLSVFKKVLPTTYDHANDFMDKRNRENRQIFTLSLKLPPKLFADARILEFGCGSGENSTYLAQCGGRMTCVDFNRNALDKLGGLFRTHGLEHRLERVVESSIFDFQDAEPASFDFILANSVLPYTHNPPAAFAHMCSFLKPGGFAVISQGTASGAFQRNLQRYILFSLAASEADIVALAKRFFPEHLRRASEIGGRAVDSVIYDSYINPRLKTYLLTDILGWFNANGLQLYSAKPSISPMFLGDSQRQSHFDITDDTLRQAVLLQEVSWLFHREDDTAFYRDFAEYFGALRGFLAALAEPFSDVSPENHGKIEVSPILEKLAGFSFQDDCVLRGPIARVAAGFEAFSSELNALFALLRAKDIQGTAEFLANASFLFKGTSGVGGIFLVGHKGHE